MTLNYEAILTEAHAIAAVAVASSAYDESKGACGFAWVTISGNEPLARHCRKVKAKLTAGDLDGTTNEQLRSYGDKGYPSGHQFWNPGNHGGQRVDIKEAGAKAFRDVLGKYGIRADVCSRLD